MHLGRQSIERTISVLAFMLMLWGLFVIAGPARWPGLAAAAAAGALAYTVTADWLLPSPPGLPRRLRAAWLLLSVAFGLVAGLPWLLPRLSRLLPGLARLANVPPGPLPVHAIVIAAAAGIGIGVIAAQRRQIAQLTRSLVATRAAKAMRERATAELQRQADYDDLSGIFNRRRIQQELQRELTRCSRDGEAAYGAWLFLDLDNFKDVNDSLGHRAGDSLVASLGRTLQALAGPSVTVGRLGGDEFALLVPNADRREAEAIAQRVLDGLQQQTFMIDNQPFQVTASLGISLYPQHGTAVADVIAGADMAMYEAKRRGRNLYTVFEPRHEAREQLAERSSWEQRVWTALAEGRFVLHCQPICHAVTGEVAMWELLLRLDERGSDLIPPLAFLDVAERFGLIADIDRWVAEQAIHLLADVVPPDVSLAMNISGKSLSDCSLAERIRQQLRAASVDPSRLIVEIPEMGAISDVTGAQRFVTQLHELGCRVAMDDHGAAFTSFNQLKRLPVDYIKIDGSLIQHVADNQADEHIVKAIVAVATGLGRETVAENVSDKRALAALREAGVDYVQGFFLGRPRPVAAQWPAATSSRGSGHAGASGYDGVAGGAGRLAGDKALFPAGL